MLEFKKGFTLAETLIVIAIIGVVAALTVPNVFDSYKKRVYVAQLQKAYSLLSNAAANFLVDQDVESMADTYMTEADGPARFMENYLKTTKICRRGSNLHNCVADEYGDRSANSEWDIRDSFSSSTSCAILEMGATVCMMPFYDTWGTQVMIDVNGRGEPNTAGRDLFQMYMRSNGSLSDISEGGGCNGYGAGCFSRIQNAGWKMDY